MDSLAAPPPPFRIGLCLSGGGYRAAAFHLGVLSYLDRCKLLSNVFAVSTVSGGAIVGAKYIQSLIDGAPAEEFFRDLYSFLSGKSLLEHCFERLGRTSPEVPSGRGNAVIALAQSYDEELFHRTNGRSLLFQDVLTADIPVTEVVFNATEFRSGLPFRFRRSSDPNIPQGNHVLSVATKDCAAVRIADIVAASSCFPAGFEPLAFPDDFAWPKGAVPAGLRAQFTDNAGNAPVAIMDGGLGDNQGIDALFEATKSWQTIDFLVVSDSDREIGNLYPFPLRPDYGWIANLRLGTVQLLCNAFACVCGLTIIVVGLHACFQARSGRFQFFWDAFLYLVPLLLAVSAYFGLRCTRQIIRNEILAQIPGLGLKAWSYLKQLMVGDFLYMLRLRRSSLSVITNNVFMNRIRELIYRAIDKDETVRMKTVKCAITDLLAISSTERADRVSPEFARCIQSAASMPTTIWLTDSIQLPSLVACGQATLCYKLQCFLKEMYSPDALQYRPDVQALSSRLASDWRTFAQESGPIEKHFAWHETKGETRQAIESSVIALAHETCIRSAAIDDSESGSR